MEKSFKFEIRETLLKEIEIKADSKEKAENILYKKINDCNIVLGAEDFYDREIKEIPMQLGKHYTISDFHKLMRNEFPNGITIYLQDESWERLNSFSDITGDECIPVNGLVNSENELLTAHGTLNAKITIKPEDYHHIYPHEDSYYDNDLSEEGYDIEDNLATSFLRYGEGIKNGRLEFYMNAKFREQLIIEGVSFNEFKNIIDTIKKKDKKIDDSIVFFEISKNKINLNKSEYNILTRPRGEYNISIAELYPELLKVICDDVLVRGTNDGSRFSEKYIDLKKDEALSLIKPKTENYSIADFIGLSSHIMCKEYNSENLWIEINTKDYKGISEDNNYQQFEIWNDDNKRKLYKNIIEKRKRISDINLYSMKNGGMAIRCKIDGIQQMGKRLDKEDINNLNENTSREMMIMKYFKQELDENNNREINKTWKR